MNLMIIYLTVYDHRMEIWKTIPSLPEYEASSLGRVRKVPHQKQMPNGGLRTYGGKPHHGQWSEQDNRYVLMYKGKTYKVARLVCETFNGPSPFDGAVVMHDDENSRNNTPTNLVWGTQKQNLNYPGFVDYCKSRTGENNPFIKGRNSI